MADDLVLRALHFYNTGEGLTRAEIVDMAKTIERQRTAMLKAATAIAVQETGKIQPIGTFRGSSIFNMLRAAAGSATPTLTDEKEAKLDRLCQDLADHRSMTLNEAARAVVGSATPTEEDK
jgi:hypothetical protein